MGKNQNKWSHRTTIIFREINIIFHPFGSLAGFPARVIVLWQENVRGTRNSSLASDRYNVVVDVVFKCLRQRSNGLKICLPAVFYIYVCFLGFIRYNKTFIACGFRKYENVFTHEYHIPLGKYDTLGWINFHISLTSMQ
jgi:hypothetical protein